jgi:hypothetical protein
MSGSRRGTRDSSTLVNSTFARRMQHDKAGARAASVILTLFLDNVGGRPATPSAPVVVARLSLWSSHRRAKADEMAVRIDNGTFVMAPFRVVR